MFQLFLSHVTKYSMVLTLIPYKNYINYLISFSVNALLHLHTFREKLYDVTKSRHSVVCASNASISAAAMFVFRCFP